MKSERLIIEGKIRDCFNEKFGLQTKNEKHVTIGKKEHEFDIF